MAYQREELEALRMYQLVEIYNEASGEPPITEFRTKAQGVQRILAFQPPMSQDEFVHALPDTATIAPIACNPDRSSVACRTRELLLQGETDDAVWRTLCREYDMTTTPSYVSWYRQGLEGGFERRAV
jgi:hypothetical protein